MHFRERDVQREDTDGCRSEISRLVHYDLIAVLQEDTLLSFYHSSLHFLLQVFQGKYSVNFVRFTNSKDPLGKDRLQYMNDIGISTDEERSPMLLTIDMLMSLS